MYQHLLRWVLAQCANTSWERCWRVLTALGISVGAVRSNSVPTLERQPWFLMSCIRLNCSRPILVCRPISEQGSAGALETKRSPSAITTRTRTFGGAWRPSSQVRHSSLTHRLPSHAADLVLSARVEGPFSRPLSSQPTILGFVLA